MPINSLKAPSRVVQYFKYQVERFLIRGPFYQVLFIGFLIGLISVICGQILIFIEPGTSGLADSSWWAFLRLSDPGYLGDDNGTAKRILATVLTILGYVLFMGSLVAIMTQWLYRKMKELEAGYTPIMLKGHICILSYTNRTPIIIEQILASKNRLKRFLRLNKTSQSRIVVLNPIVGHELTTDLQEYIGPGRDLQKVIFRTGESMRGDDLGRINVENSSVVIMPSTIYGDKNQVNSDTRVIKSLLSVRNRAESRGLPIPRAVVEILDEQHGEIAKLAYGHTLEVVSGRILLSRMIAQNIQNPSLSYVIAELIAQGEGSEIYLKHCPELIGKEWAQIRNAFPNTIIIGIVSQVDTNRCILNPLANEKILVDDLLIFISGDFETINLDKNLISETNTREYTNMTLKREKKKRKLLLMGWSNKSPLLIKELFETQKYEFEVDIISLSEISLRDSMLDSVLTVEQKIHVKQIKLDYTSSKSMSEVDFLKYDNIVFVSSDRANDGSDADARSILGLLQVRNILGESSNIPILIELAEPENEKLFASRKSETIISPMVISYILGNVALRPELNEVFDCLFNAGGADITFMGFNEFNLSEGKKSFKSISENILNYQMIAIGVMDMTTSQIYLNPKPSKMFEISERCKVIVIHS